MSDEEKSRTLGVSVGDEVKTKELFGKLGNKMAGIGGTLHITDEAGVMNVPTVAWELSKQTKKPVVIVVKHP